MKKIIAVMITVLILVSSITVSVYAGSGEAPKQDDQIIFGDTYILEENSVLDGDLVAINCIVIIKENAIITGDIVLIGSSININAEIYGSLIAFGGVVNLFDGTVIHGDLITPGAETYRAAGSEVFGQLMTSELNDSKNIEYFNDIESLLDGIDFSNINNIQKIDNSPIIQNSILNPVARVLWIMFSSFIVSIVSVIVVLVFRKRAQVITEAIRKNPFESGGFGLITLLVVFPILTVIFVILGITIILLPISLLVFIIMALISFIGWVMTCMEIGRVIIKAMKRDWSDAVVAGIGSFIMTFLIMGMNLILWDIFGWIIGLVLASLGVGSLLLTRLGNKQYKKKDETVVSAEIK